MELQDYLLLDLNVQEYLTYSRGVKLVGRRPDASHVGHTHLISAKGKNVMKCDSTSLTPMAYSY